ncbi:ATP-dependent RNA helicase [Williamsoniiplasma somnilux]|uniref:ATP-dependent RNA helicase n=1 Tax=Williamsoniiplasma somnilux TaxID=215578 RepID=A0A2K8NYF9_9MOLU|nr:DEAD/DEAH box helicase [Williamsoniiplasma somnilux]ATZ18784.1 ATP-dependent RNA helicase [Williamsoniiplasma somnilux]
MLFSSFGFKKYINDTLFDIGFETPTSIQNKVIPLIKKHKNVIGLAHTGTGKTHSFLLPILNNLDLNVSFEKRHVQAIIIAPTRELAKQIFDNIKPFQKQESKITCGLFIGGEDINKNISNLRKTQPMIVVGTPTRIKELYEQNELRITTASYVVVDECDMIFDLGFIEDVDFMISRVNQNVVISLFSATIDENLRPFIKKYLKNSIFIDDSESIPSTKNVEHILIDTKNKEIELVLSNLVKSINPYMCLIFVNSKDNISSIVKILRKNNVGHVGELHGNLQPRTRMATLKKVKNNDFKYVVATDVAARGVDIEGVSHVISINLPSDSNYYIHRSGRTGRSNLKGKSYVLFNIKNQQRIEELKNKGIEFSIQKLVEGELIDIKQREQKKKKNNLNLDTESKIVISKYKNTKVKPGYKKKRKDELEKIKQKRKREHIKESIAKIKKEKYKRRRSELFGD